MLLQRLREYAIRQDLPPVGCAKVPIRYLIRIGREGNFIALVDTATPEHKRGEFFVAPDYGSRTSGNFAIILADHAQYTLGIDIPGKKRTSTPGRHNLYKERITACADATREPPVQSIGRFLESFKLEDIPLPEDFDPEAKMTFEIEGTYPAQLSSVQAWWAQQMSTADTSHWLECLVCGELCHPLIILPTQIHGIPGGQSTGMALISGQVEAAESYGLERSHYASICALCAHQVTAALNLLLRQPGTHTIIGDRVYVYWSEEEEATPPLSEITEAAPGEIDAFLSSPWRGDLELNASHFYMAALKANDARVVVCDWIESTLSHIQGNLRRYFQWQRIVDKAGVHRYFPLWQLAEAGGKRSEAAILRCAFAGDQLSLHLIHHAVRGGAELSTARAALLKMILSSRAGEEGGGDLVDLDVNRTDPAYLCGRIFATLEAIEWKAQGTISQGIKSYYASATSRPATVFAILLRRGQWHLRKMQRDRDKFGAFYGLNRQLTELLALLGDFPATLTLTEQALFALGSYHQKIASKQAAQAAAAERKRDEA